jgi:hypothetical protein
MNVVIFGIFTLALVFSLFIKPRTTFYFIIGSLMAFFEPLTQINLFNVGNANVYGSDLMMVSLSIYLMQRFLRQKLSLYPASVRWASIFFLWGILSIIRGIPYYGYRAIGEARWYVIMPLLCYYFVLLNFNNKQQIREIMKVGLGLLIVTLVVRIVAFYILGGRQSEWWPFDPEDPRSEFRFIGATTNLLVAWALILLLLFYVFGKLRKSHFMVYILFGLLLASIIIPQTRSVWISTATGVLILIVFVGFHFTRRGIPLQGILFLASVVFLIVFFSPLIVSFMGKKLLDSVIWSASFLQNPTSDPTGSWRLLGWQQELEKAMQQPFFGQGLGGYSEWFDGQKWQQVAVHNGYIMHFSKFGILGITLIFMMLVFWYKEIAKYIRLEKDGYYKLLAFGFQICILMDLVFAFFYEFTVFFWILIAICTALVRGHQHEIR